jgi:hypothetical protein
MKRLLRLSILAVLLSGCYKDEVDIAALNNNPFDRDYAGEAVFVFEETYVQQVSTGGTTVLLQIIVFRVREDLFLAPASYSIALRDLQNGNDNGVAIPDPSGGGRYRYQRAPAPGVPICLELRLANNFSTARAETICATL